MERGRTMFDGILDNYPKRTGKKENEQIKKNSVPTISQFFFCLCFVLVSLQKKKKQTFGMFILTLSYDRQNKQV